MRDTFIQTLDERVGELSRRGYVPTTADGEHVHVMRIGEGVYGLPMVGQWRFHILLYRMINDMPVIDGERAGDLPDPYRADLESIFANAVSPRRDDFESWAFANGATATAPHEL